MATQARKSSAEHLIGFCLGCHYAHTKSETQIVDGVLCCKETGLLVERFSNPRLMAISPQPLEIHRPLSRIREQTIEELMRVGILDVAFHAGINLGKNREALEVIVSKLAALLPESEQV